jgi:TetR/AcrR family transcriptional regulator, tetracycline repressor protein
VPTPSPLQLESSAIVEAAIDILREQGLDAVSMRTVAARLGVSPFPLYSRIGNKDALLDAMAERLLADLAPAGDPAEAWPDYARRWAHELRRRLRGVPDSRLVLGPRRWAYVDATGPLAAALRRGGVGTDETVRACRMLMWATIGFVVTESGARPDPPSASDRDRTRLAGGDPAGVTDREADTLFELQLDYLLAGLTGSVR